MRQDLGLHELIENTVSYYARPHRFFPSRWEFIEVLSKKSDVIRLCVLGFYLIEESMGEE